MTTPSTPQSHFPATHGVAVASHAVHNDGYPSSVKGDRVEIVVDTGGGTARRYEVSATRAGRRVEITTGRGVVEVAEVTRSGTQVRTARFMSGRVVALVEHPAQQVTGVPPEDAPGDASRPDPVELRRRPAGS